MYDTVLVGTDGSDESDAALSHAIELAEFHDATVHAVMVVERRPRQFSFGVEDVDELNRAVEELVEEIVEQYEDRDVDIYGEVRQGNPASILLSYAHEIDADLIIVGQRGADHIEQALLGSTADRLARLTDIPLSIIPAENS